MANTIVSLVERKGRISIEAAHAEYNRLLVGVWRERHKAEVDEKMTKHGHADYIPKETENE